MANNYKLYLYKPAALNLDPTARQAYFLGELLVDNLQANIKLNEISDITFTLPRIINQELNTRLDEVLDNYIVELWYGDFSDREKIRFILITTPLSFEGDVYTYSYTGVSIDGYLENRNIVKWTGVEVRDYFKKINYNKTIDKFLNTNTPTPDELTISPAVNGNADFITISPTTLTQTEFDIYIKEYRENGDKQSFEPMIPYQYNWSTRATNAVKFTTGYYHLDLVDGLVTAIHIAVPNSTDRDLFDSGKLLSYYLYENPTSRNYAVGFSSTNTLDTDSMYIDLMLNYNKTDGTSNVGVYAFATETYFTRNGLTLKQIMLGDVEEQNLKENGLLYGTGFTLGTITAGIAAKYRSNIELNNITVYQAIKNVAEKFAAVPVFDTYNNTVSFYEENEYGVNNGLFIGYGTYLKGINKQIDAGKIGTLFRALGKDNLTINLINPTGESYWEDYTYYLDDYKNLTVSSTGGVFSFGSTAGFKSRWISDSIVLNLAKWQKVRDYFHAILNGEVNPTDTTHQKYYDLYSKRDEEIRKYVKLETEYDQYSANKYKYKYLMDYYNKQYLINNVTSDNNNFIKYKDLYDKALAAEEDFKRDSMDPVYKKIYDDTESLSYATYINEIKTIIDSYYPTDTELAPFKKELVFNDNSLDNEKDLLEGLLKFVEENREPKVTIDINIVDILAAQEAQQDHDKILVGDKVNIFFDEFNIDIEAQIREISVDFEQNSLSLVISTTKNYNKGFGNYLTKVVRKLYNTTTNIVNYSNDGNNKAQQDATASANAIIDGLRAEQTKYSVGPQDSTGAHAIVQSGAGINTKDISSVDETTGVVTFSGEEKRLDFSAGAIVATTIAGSNVVKTGMGSDFGFFIAKSTDGEDGEYSKQFYVDVDGNAIFAGTLSAGIVSLFDAAGAATTAYTNAVADANDYTDGLIGALQTQIDGAISTWFYSGAPTLLNLPASDWDTNDKKDDHLGDLYYDTATGYGYRFAFDGGVYKWIQIVDTDVTTALANAAAAQTTANSKITVFTASSDATYTSNVNSKILDKDVVMPTANFTATVANNSTSLNADFAFTKNDTYIYNSTTKTFSKVQNVENKDSGSVAGWTINTTDIKANNNKMTLHSDSDNSGYNPYISINQSTQGFDQNGIFLGIQGETGSNNGVAKLSLKSATNSLSWNGSALEIVGTIKQSSSIETAAGSFTTNDTLTYDNNITGGTRTITYAANGTTPNPSTSLEFSSAPKVGSTSWSDKVSYSWSATGSMSGTSTTSTFIPSIAANLTNNTTVILTVTYYTNTTKNVVLYTKTDTIIIAVTRVGDTGAQGPQGIQGPIGPVGATGAGVLYRGVYDPDTIYFHTDIRRDVVQYLSSYYIVNDMTKSGTDDWDTPWSADWEAFGAEFSSVATDILFAQDVYANKTINIGTNNSTPVIALNSDPDTNNPFIGLVKTSYSDTTAGAFIGFDSGTPKLNIGNSTNWLKWTGSAVDIKGSINATSGQIGGWTIGPTSLTAGTGLNGIGLSISNTYAFWAGNTTAASAPFSVTQGGVLKSTSGSIGGWNINNTDISSTNMKIASGTSPYISVKQTTTGYANDGIFLGIDSNLGKFSAVNGSTSWLKWNGSELDIKGSITATSGTVGAVKLNNYGVDQTVNGSLQVGTDTLVDYTDNYWMSFTSSNYQYSLASTKRKVYILDKDSQLKNIYLKVSVSSVNPNPTNNFSLIVSYSLDNKILRIISYTATASVGNTVTFNIAVDNIIDRLDIFAADQFSSFTITSVSSSSSIVVSQYPGYQPYILIEDQSLNRTAEIYETGTAKFKVIQSDIITGSDFLYGNNIRILNSIDSFNLIATVVQNATNWTTPINVSGYSAVIITPFRIVGATTYSAETFTVDLTNSNGQFNATTFKHRLVYNEGGINFNYSIDVQEVTFSGTGSSTGRFITLKSDNTSNGNKFSIYGIKGLVNI